MKFPIGLFATCWAGPAEEIKTFHEAYAKFKLAGKADAAAKLLQNTLTPDFMHSGLNGIRLNRAQYIEQVKKQLATSKYSKCSTKLSPVVKGNGGLMVTTTITYSMKAKGADGKMHTYAGTTETDEMWTLIGKSMANRRSVPGADPGSRPGRFSLRRGWRSLLPEPPRYRQSRSGEAGHRR
jgi:hypothetical protein